MNRRNFFTSIGLILAGASAPGIFLPKFEPVRWKVKRPIRIVPNPEYATAPYETYFLDMRPLIDQSIIDENAIIIERRLRDFDGGFEYWTPRFKLVNGEYVHVHPFIEA